MNRFVTLPALLLALAASGCAQKAAPVTEAGVAGPLLETADVDLFYRLYDASGGHPTAAQLQEDYLLAGSDGLRTLARLRNLTGERILAAIEREPSTYERARDCVAVLPAARTRLAAALARLTRLFPDADFPPVTIAVGRGRPVGVGSPETGVQIGIEALCGADFLNPDPEDRLVLVVVHEYVHTLQAPAMSDGENLTVLEAALMEGGAEFVTEQVAGAVSYSYLAGLVAGREGEIERAFAASLDSRDLSPWLYNTSPESPGDLGYWTGYRIARAYHEKAADKDQALRDIIGVTDANAFLAVSGWTPAE